jgi:asparagine synthase (glutamine-hydrolysing)
MDKMVADFSIDYRHPMLDKRLIEFCYAVPTRIKYSKGWGRMLARKGLAEILPPEIQWRTNKTNFNPVFEKNLLKFEKKRLNKILQNKIIKKYIDCKLVRNMFHKYEKGEIGSNSLDLWRITILSIWLNQNKEI